MHLTCIRVVGARRYALGALHNVLGKPMPRVIWSSARRRRRSERIIWRIWIDGPGWGSSISTRPREPSFITEVHEDEGPATLARDSHLENNFLYTKLEFDGEADELCGDGDRLAAYAAAAAQEEAKGVLLADLRDEKGLRAVEKEAEAIMTRRERREAMLDGRTAALKRHWIFRAGDEATWIQGSSRRNCVIVSVSGATGVYRILTDNAAETTVYRSDLATRVVTYIGSQDEREVAIAGWERTLAARRRAKQRQLLRDARGRQVDLAPPTGAARPSTTTRRWSRPTTSSCAASIAAAS